jgi:hypothetical protein
MTQYVVVARYEDEAPEVFGPFENVSTAQAAALKFRTGWDIPGHENVEPTSEENEAWDDAGWYFGIVELSPESSLDSVDLAR